MAISKYDDLPNIVLGALRDLGGSATNQELEDKLIEILQVPEDEAYLRREEKSQTRLNYRIAWANSYLKKTSYIGLIDGPEWFQAI